jgi:hypothetical protein
MSRFAAFALSVLLVAGCSRAGSWHNPSFTSAQRDADLAECRHLSEADMGDLPNTEPGSDKFDTPMQMVDRSEMRSHFSALVADCMERKGYLRGP